MNATRSSREKKDRGWEPPVLFFFQVFGGKAESGIA
jgi:hypothetical protein